MIQTKILTRIARDERGATAIEYGLIVALIAIAMIVAAGNVGDELSTTMSTVDATLSDANSVV